MMRRIVLTVFGALALTTLVACGNDAPAPAPAPTPKAKKVVADAAATTDGGTAADDSQYVYVYNPVGKRDPFRAENEGPKQGDGSDTGGKGPDCSEPLCNYDIEQLTLVGVVSGDANPVAMLEAPDHVGHIVRRNTRVGKQGGKVTAISSDCIVVTEYFQTPDGRVNPNKVNICVKKDDAVEKTVDLFNNKAVQ